MANAPGSPPPGGYTTDIHEQFRAALRSRGIIPPELLIDDGQLHRCDAVGHEGGRDATYVLYCNGFPAGGFQNWTDGADWQHWRAELEHPPTAEELEELRQRAEADRAQRELEETARRTKAARRAAAMWANASACTEHAYLTRKRVQPHGLRVSGRGDLIIPVRDAGGMLHSLQFISPDGTKRYLPDGRIRGCYFPIGGDPATTVMVGEGFATCASAHEAAGHAVAVAFDCGNLLPVAEALRATPTMDKG